MKRQLNLRFLGILVAVAVVVGGGGHLLHGFQVRNTAAALLAKAVKARDAENWEEATNHYARYLQFYPEDMDVLTDYGLASEHEAKSFRQRQAVFLTLDKALRFRPDRADARRRLVDVAMEIGRFNDARDHLKKLQEASPDNPELDYLLGRCSEGLGDYGAAAKLYRAAIDEDKESRESKTADPDDPGQVASYVRLADLFRQRLSKPRDADKTMDELVDTYQSWPALVARAHYFRTGGSGLERDKVFVEPALLSVETITTFAGGGSPVRGAMTAALAATRRGAPDLLLFKAELDLKEARQAKPTDAEVLLESAQVARAGNWFASAEAYARRGLDTHPKDVRFYKLAAEMEVQLGQGKEAVAVLRKGLEQIPDDAVLIFLFADLLIDENQLPEADAQIARLKTKAIEPAFLDYLEGHRRFVAEDWLEASNRLERAYAGLVRWRDLARQTALLLGVCYEQMDDPDQQYTAYRRAVTEDPYDPLWLPASDGVARALLGMNNVNDALDAYRKLIPRAPAARLVVARLLIVRNLGLPEGQRKWPAVNKLLDETAVLLPKSPEVPILRVQVLAAQAGTMDKEKAQSRYRDAQIILDEASAEQPKNARLWVARAALESIRGKAPRALKILDDAEQEMGDLVELRLARIRFTLQLDAAEIATSLGKIGDGLEKFSKAEQVQVCQALAEAHTALGELAKARQLLERIVELKPHDLRVRLSLFDLALQSNDESGMDALLADIRRLEGPKGSLWRYGTAARLIRRAQQGDKHALDEARPLLTAVAGLRPTWSRVPVCKARVEVLSGNPDAAARHYLLAIDMGERNPYVLLEALRLLQDRRAYDEAYQVIRKLPEQTPLLQQISGLVVDLSLRAKDTSTAERLAAKAVADNPNDYRNHLALAQVYWSLNETAKAEAAHREALRCKDTIAETWVPYILFLVRNNRLEDAKTAINAAKDKLSEDKYPVAFALCYEAVKDTQRAEELYAAARKAYPNDPATLRAAAEYYLRAGNSKEAERCLRQLVEQKQQAPEAAAAARRLLAIVLAGEGGDYEKKRQTLADLGYLDQPVANVSETPDDKRARAFILAAQGRRRDRENAVQVLEDVGRIQPLTTADQFMLAQLYESLGNRDKTRALMHTVLDKNGTNPNYLRYFIRILLLWKELDDAEKLLVQLENVSNAKTWPVVQLRARLLHAQGKDADAAKRLLELANDKDAKDPPLLPIAQLLEQIGQVEEAKGIYQRVVDKTKKPEAPLILAGFLGRTGHLPEALDVCDQVRRAGGSPEVVFTMALEILYEMNPRKEDQDRVENWIKEALRASGDNAQRKASLRQSLATLANLQGNYDDAEKTYRLCLEENPRDVLSMNNLAWLLATRGGNAAEALTLIQRAINFAGPLTDLLDTRAVIYLYLGKNGDAVKELEELLADRPTATGFFHLARAHGAVDHPKDALADFQKAIDLGLKEKDVHPFERAEFRTLATRAAEMPKTL